jgi:hypothetical protein
MRRLWLTGLRNNRDLTRMHPRMTTSSGVPEILHSSMALKRQQLAALIEDHYRSNGWKVERRADGTVRAAGLGGVTWIGLPVVTTDLADEQFETRLLTLGEERTPEGKRCPLELLPASDCGEELRALLRRLRLDERGHVEVYSTAV